MVEKEKLSKLEERYLEAVLEYLFSLFNNIDPYLNNIDTIDIKWAVQHGESIEAFIKTILY